MVAWVYCAFRGAQSLKVRFSEGRIGTFAPARLGRQLQVLRREHRTSRRDWFPRGWFYFRAIHAGPLSHPPPSDSCIRIALSNFRRCRSRREADAQWICRARTTRVIDSLRAISRSSPARASPSRRRITFIQSWNDSRSQRRFPQVSLGHFFNWHFFEMQK